MECEVSFHIASHKILIFCKECSFQVQQQLQSMYEIPNRNMQIAQQIEQLQLRLQYLQQCYMSECHGGAQRNEQPVSVMQRGSEVQVLLILARSELL